MCAVSKSGPCFLPISAASALTGANLIGRIATSPMSAFNALNGVPATANPYLLRDVLRTAWGFNGLVVSDYTAIMELRNHGVALDAATATRKAFLAGVDIDMPRPAGIFVTSDNSFFQRTARSALNPQTCASPSR